MKKVDSKDASAGAGFAVFFWGRILAGLGAAVIIIWLTAVAVNFWEKFSDQAEPETAAAGHATPMAATADHDQRAAANTPAVAGSKTAQHGDIADPGHGQAVAVTGQAETTDAPAGHGATDVLHVSDRPAHAVETPAAAPQVKGIAFVDAMIKPMEFELQQRRWGWRPNDLVQYTDNVNNFQLGLLEATRRSTRMLAERISRTGTTNILDENLETAMNWFMVKADSYLFPSAEEKYKEGLQELRKYKQRLLRGEADFYTRADNLIPLVSAFADLLGSCDQNLVKKTEKNGKPVTSSTADDYFYYAKGAASAILPILEAVAQDFHETLETRRAGDVLHHAIHSCHEASGLEPLIVLESDMDGLFANHRANMAAYISHARFYLDVLAATLSI